MRELVRGYADAALESAAGAGRLAQVHDELAGFERALRVDELFRVLTDPAVPETARYGVVNDLLAPRTAPETTDLVGFAVRVERAPELPAVLAALLSLAAARLSEGDRPPPAATGFRAVRSRIRGYAERVLQELESNDVLDEVEDELFRIGRLFDDHPELRRALSGLDRGLDERVAIAEDLLAGRAEAATLRLVRYVLRSGQVRDLAGTFGWLADLVANERGRRIGEVRAAVELNAAERERLATALSGLVDRTVEVRVILDPTVIGGALVSVGDLVIDGTVRLRLERLRELIAPAG